MNPRRILDSGITASAIAHLSALLLLLFFTEVHPFGSVTAEPITVDIVPAAEAPPDPRKDVSLPESTPLPSDAADPSPQDTSSKSAASPPPVPPQSAAPPPAAPQQVAREPKPPPPKPPPPQRQANAQPQPQPPPQPPTAAPPQPAYAPPQPDLSVKYGVMLGLPPALPVDPASDRKSGDDFGSPATKTADISSEMITAFRRHLKTCSKLPASIAPADNIKITLRVLMTTDGTLAAEPIIVEGTASVKALDLKQSAVEALEACQPYTMLPADRYGEWKVLDLSFSPQDFG